MTALRLDLESIVIGERHRALSEDAVARLAASMSAIGLRSPITVRVVDDYVLSDGEVCDGVPVLVAGRHRLAAAKSLGWTHIDCIDADDDAITAEMWEIAENLHRLDLTKDQRDEHIRRYAELIATQREAAKPGQTVQVSGGRGNKSIATEVAEQTGLNARTVRRALAPAPEPKAPLPDHDVFTVQFNALMAAWNRAGPDVREAFLTEIDTPVFDNTRAAA